MIGGVAAAAAAVLAVCAVAHRATVGWGPRRWHGMVRMDRGAARRWHVHGSINGPILGRGQLRCKLLRLLLCTGTWPGEEGEGSASCATARAYIEPLRQPVKSFIRALITSALHHIASHYISSYYITLRYITEHT